MKLSTRIKKYVHPIMLWNPKERCAYSPLMPGHSYGDDYIDRVIVFMVDSSRDFRGKWYQAITLSDADKIHEYLTKKCGCTLLPLNECPVVTEREIIMHYTSTTYKEWCEGGC